jgi:uncharacterized protein YdhG (YjbR/CyaY superfamily)
MSTLIKKFKDIDEYHRLFPENIKELLETIRVAVKQTAPNAVETISYGMPAFKQNKILIYYAAHKNHIGIYPTAKTIEAFEAELEQYATSKGAIQIPLDKKLPIALIKKIVKFRVEEDQNKLKSTNKATILHGILHEMPDDLKNIVLRNKILIDKWNKLTPIQRNEWICWITMAKKSETKEIRIERMLTEIKEGKKQPCCWPGCPHRRPNAQKWFSKSKVK